MTLVTRVLLLLLAAFVVTSSNGLASEAWRGACYCRFGRNLECTKELTERECRRHCDEGLADDWLWRERLPCWNWGYGG
jgi:hypothetical protein